MYIGKKPMLDQPELNLMIPFYPSSVYGISRKNAINCGTINRKALKLVKGIPLQKYL